MARGRVVIAPIAVLDRDGVPAFSFDPHTDPPGVLHAVAWAYVEGQKICDMHGCPATDGGYCIDCHVEAANARDEARRRQAVSV